MKDRRAISALPFFEIKPYIFSKRSRCETILDRFENTYLCSGRAAIAFVLEKMGIGVKDDVLMPSFHCPSMVEPVEEWIRASPVFYKMNVDLTLDLEDLRLKINSRTKVVIVVHYFGFAMDFKDVRDLCNEKNIYLIEDCAHAIFCDEDGMIGRYGDFLVSSPRKFFPIFDGGTFIESRRRVPDNNLKENNVKNNLKSIYNSIITNQRTKVLQKKIDRDWHEKQKQNFYTKENDDYRFSKKARRYRMPLASQVLYKLYSKEYIRQSRIKNYQYLVQGLDLNNKMKFLYESLKECIVPYSLPLVIQGKNSDVYFRLRNRGLMMWRWDVLHATECKVSKFYSENLLQLPCHQSLNKEDLDFIISVVNYECK